MVETRKYRSFRGIGPLDGTSGADEGNPQGPPGDDGVAPAIPEVESVMNSSSSPSGYLSDSCLRSFLSCPAALPIQFLEETKAIYLYKNNTRHDQIFWTHHLMGYQPAECLIAIIPPIQDISSDPLVVRTCSQYITLPLLAVCHVGIHLDRLLYRHHVSKSYFRV